MAEKKKSLNFLTLLIFAPILVLAGILGFVIPPEMSLMSGAAAYNVFHLFFGCLGILFVWMKNERPIRWFNIGFGLLDLYQAAASFAHLFPEEFFQWKTADDVLHIVIGLALVLIGIFGSKGNSP